MASNRRVKQVHEALEALEQAGTSLEALDAARRLNESAAALERERVEAARKDGHSWSQIGALYGMTKQGAQQRFNAERARRKRKPPPEE